MARRVRPPYDASHLKPTADHHCARDVSAHRLRMQRRLSTCREAPHRGGDEVLLRTILVLVVVVAVIIVVLVTLFAVAVGDGRNQRSSQAAGLLIQTEAIILLLLAPVAICAAVYPAVNGGSLLVSAAPVGIWVVVLFALISRAQTRRERAVEPARNDSWRQPEATKLQRPQVSQVPGKRPAKPRALVQTPNTQSSATEPQRAQALSPRKRASAAKMSIAKQRPPKQTGFAIQPPTDCFVLVCECPHCGALDTHDLRAPLRPAPPEPPPDDTNQPQREEKSHGVTRWLAGSPTRTTMHQNDPATPPAQRNLGPQRRRTHPGGTCQAGSPSPGHSTRIQTPRHQDPRPTTRRRAWCGPAEAADTYGRSWNRRRET
jgi:hypothetical protein